VIILIFYKDVTDEALMIFSNATHHAFYEDIVTLVEEEWMLILVEKLDDDHEPKAIL
jgi:hypothetical protein